MQTLKPNIRKALMEGWLTIEVYGAWHPIPLDEDGIVG